MIVERPVLGQLAMERLVTEPGGLESSECDLDVLPASADGIQMTDHSRAALFDDSVSEKAGVDGLVAQVKRHAAHYNVANDGMEAEGGHQTRAKH